MQCVILAGGLATRMRPVTLEIPKALIPVNGRPFADIQLSWLASCGVSNVVYCIGHLGSALSAHVGDGSRWGLRVTYADEGERLRGTGGALRLALTTGLLEDRFMVTYGDSYLPIDVAEPWRVFLDADAEALMSVFRNAGRFGPSNAAFDGRLVTRYAKDVPDPSAEGLTYIDYGLLALKSDFVEAIPADVPSDLAPALTRAAAEGRLAGWESPERFYEIGSPAGLAALEAVMRTP